MKHKILDLFSGIGGFSYGFEMANLGETIAFVEKDKFCQKVLRKHWKNVPIIDDIRKVNGKDFGTATIISGGFPCQPFSVAGKRKGKDDDRYLWDETIRVVAECKPRWFIGENVEGLININNGLVLRQVQTDLEEQGFQVQCLVIPASGIGAWHQRKRIWIIATNPNNYGSYRSQGDATKQSCNEQEKWLSFGDDKDVSNSDTRFSKREDEEIQTGWNTFNNGSQNVSDTDSRMCGGRGAELKSGNDREWGFYSKEEEQAGDDIRSKAIGCDAVLGEERKTWWQTQSEFCGVPNGISAALDKDRTNRIKSLGNSIVPQIARQLGLAIMESELNG